jgi:hypothetical protein
VTVGADPAAAVAPSPPARPQICKDCHFNVVRAFKDIKAGREVPNAACSTSSTSSSGGAPPPAATSAAAAAGPGSSTVPPSSIQADSAAAAPGLSAGSGQPCVVHQCNPLSSRAAAAQPDGKSRPKRPSTQQQQQPQQQQQQVPMQQPHGAGMPGEDSSSTATGAGATADGTTTSSSSSGGPVRLELSPGTWMSVSGGMVTITHPATSMRGFFDAAEDVQVNKVRVPQVGTCPQAMSHVSAGRGCPQVTSPEHAGATCRG